MTRPPSVDVGLSRAGERRRAEDRGRAVSTPGAPFRYREVERWPPLGWLAACAPDRDAVTVFHGPAVETRRDWFGEIVWDAPFPQGGFDRTDVVFGTGGRWRDGDVTFVPSGTMVDRLQHLERGGTTWVSNSLVCLAAVHEAEVDPTYGGYLYDFRSVTEGIGRSDDRLETTAGTVRLTYYRNLRWDGRALEEVPKPRPDRRFLGFDEYRAFLFGRLEGLSDNLSDERRDRPFHMLGTLSSGYDSPAVAALCREVGLERAITFTEARRGIDDSGEEIGRALDLRVEPYRRSTWLETRFAEVPFLAGSATAGEVYLSGSADRLSGAVLMTGEYGGNLWSRRRTDPDGVLETGDPAGLSLTEYRLWEGFVHCPVPYLGARRADDVLAISNSPEMRPWTVGGYYDRPIPRRIVEEAGCPRRAFGQAKAYGAVSFSHPDVFWSRDSAREFVRWLRERRGEWLRRAKVPPGLVSRVARPIQRAGRALADSYEVVGRDGSAPPALLRKLRFLGEREYLFKFMFPWALERATGRYPRPRALEEQ